MRKKPVKYILGLAILIVLAYNSVYFQKLDEAKKASVTGDFNATDFSKKLWDGQMGNAIGNAIEMRELDSLLKADPQAAFTKKSNALSIGNYRYFLVKTNGVINTVGEDEVIIDVQSAGRSINAIIATEFIYGNAIRDASKLVEVKDFNNSADLNAISAELNNIVRKTVIPPFKAAAKKGDRVELTGAIEINKEHIRLDSVELIPVQLKIVN